VVAEEVGHCSGAIVCPYHGWSYGFDGKLRAVREEKSFQNLDKKRLGLFELELEEWMGFVFVRFGGSGPSVEASMRPFAAEAGHYRFADMKPWGRRSSVDCDFNWKLFVENDAEGYHIPTGHPGLRRLFGNTYADDADSNEPDAFRSIAVLQDKESPVWGERAYQRLLPAVDHLPASHRRAWVYYAVFPTAVLQVSPDLVDCYQVLPAGPDRCRIHGFAVALEDDRREMRAARYLTTRLNRQVFNEDVDFCRWTDTGVRSSGYPGGVLSDLESGVREFQDRIREMIPVSRRAKAPPAGRVAAVNSEMQRDD
jgi:phenylpropionate dioxygenase-like ring-hydroxylating dioxygenase large terminal subunit